MRRSWAPVLLGALLTPAIASAGNTEEVNAGLDVTLTGGAVVATVYTGAALWYNPAGLARIDKPSLELTGVTINLQIIKNPGLITTDSMPQAKSEGAGFNVSVIPQAITFSLKLKNENLKLGIGLFNSSIRREFITEQAISTDTSPEVEAFAGRNSRLDFFHISSGLAGRFGRNRKQQVLFGGALDLVIATGRVDDSYTILYDKGNEGQINSSQVQTTTGFGFQLKAGMQWVPIKPLRIGLSATTPTYVFAALERFSNAFSQAPPVGTPFDPDDPNQQIATGGEGRGGQGVWWGVEPGNLRFGVAYVGDWGWLEGDLIYYFRLREDELGLNLRGFLNGRLGSAFRVTKHVKLGVGAFTDFSQVDQLARLPLATRDIDFFGVHLGFLYSTEEVHPDRQASGEKDGLGISIAVGIRYSHGRGNTLGLLVPAEYNPSQIANCADPGGAPEGADTCLPVATKVNEIGINLGAKVAF
jgi:hypothetical protein